MPAENKQSEDAIEIERAVQGDARAFEHLVHKYYSKIYALTYNMTGNNTDAEDVTQEVFIKAHKNLGRFKGRSSFYTWIYRIAINHTINHLKRRNRHCQYSLDDVDSGIERDPAFLELTSESEPFRNADLSEIQKKLNESIQQLSDKHKAVVVMHDVEGIPHEKIAKIMNCSTGTVRSRLFYARKQLQSYLEEFRP